MGSKLCLSSLSITRTFRYTYTATVKLQSKSTFTSCPVCTKNGSSECLRIENHISLELAYALPRPGVGLYIPEFPSRSQIMQLEFLSWPQYLNRNSFASKYFFHRKASSSCSSAKLHSLDNKTFLIRMEENFQ